ncbi:hypothetical protein J2Y69_002253 [Microbacterium resistens]|uniref:Diguanylate cyclase n=1 Tax=Microbacterium resistens TaxID=156977 RepID=A0ABU1SDK2_9MICO|nr:hypothetical protein [Microbacterium resistens]MDR6867649.1 hypothetical protein [Microbacterium resistens]
MSFTVANTEESLREAEDALYAASATGDPARIARAQDRVRRAERRFTKARHRDEFGVCDCPICRDAA